MYHVLRIPAGREVEATKGLDVYIPMLRYRRFNRAMRVWQHLSQPMFPGYAFIRLDDPVSFRSLAPSAHFCRLARNSDRSFMTVREQEIAALRVWEVRVEKANQNVSAPITMRRIEVGDEVALSDLIRGIVVAVEGDEVLIEAAKTALGTIRTKESRVRRTAA